MNRKMLACGVFLFVLVVSMMAGRAHAVMTQGSCIYRQGVCYRALDEVVDRTTSKEYMTTVPKKPWGWISHDMVTGQNSSAHFQSPGDNSAGVSGSDEMLRALSLIAKPWLDEFFTTLVKVESRFPNQPSGTISLCSGTLLGSHTVLTAGHCIFSHEYGGWAEEVWVYPAMAGYHLTPFGEATAASVESTTWWAEDHDHRGDTGIIRLNENSGDLTGWPELIWGYSSLNGTLYSAGYPSEGNYDGQQLYQDSGSVESLTDYLICHSMHTVKGMSGGPGWVVDQSVKKVTAVNSYCETDGLCCMARYIDLVEQQRKNSEAQSADDPPAHWTCPMAQYSSGDGCHCLCGAWDPDCDVSSYPAEGCDSSDHCIKPGQCVCAPQCDGKECGPDGCGAVCGWCDGGAPCTNGICNCVADCTGKQCGSDGCGGDCGTCPEGSVCEGGRCSCSADCEDKECGPDGCGGLCGQCEEGLGCVSGKCGCVPDCASHECGSDGCGGDCGSCAEDQDCVDGRCVCTYNCIDRECGSDGCGGSCGFCEEGQVCKAGSCVGDGSGQGCGCGVENPFVGSSYLILISALLSLLVAFRRK